MLEKGELIWVNRDELDIYLRSHVADEPRLLVEKIADFCFGCEVEAIILFLNQDKGDIKPSCYMPIYNDVSILEQGGFKFSDIDGCIFLDALFIEDIQKITNAELLFTVKDTAIRAGYWREEYGIVALS